MSKKIILYFFIITLCHLGLLAQSGWTQKANFSGGARAFTSEFTIGHYAFVGCGYNGSYFDDFYKWDETTNTWSAIANYPGAGFYNCTAFAIEGKGYVCLGLSGFSTANDLWEYDTTTNSWTQMATFPGVARYDAEAFVIGHKAYIIAGSTGGPPYLQDVWEYDAHQNTWTQKANWPGGLVEEIICFAIGNHGYAGDGWYPSCTQQMYEYDTTSDTWTSIANVPPASGITEQPDVWVSGSRAYLCTGGNCSAAGLRDGWMYDTVTKSWCEFNYIAASKLSRGNGVAFSINNRGYFCTGQDTNLNYLKDLWEYTPYTKINAADTTSLCGGDSVHFSDSSSYIASAWSWSFSGGSPATSSLQNPVVYYSSSGTYSVTLILTACGGGDTVNKSVTVTVGTSPVTNAYVISEVKCNGGCDGSAIDSTTGGSSPYIYTWSPSAESTAMATALCAGGNIVTVTDRNGCTATAGVTITQPAPIVITETINNAVCNGGEGSAAVTPAGGVSPYTYLWTPSHQTTSTATGLIAGSYTIQVTDKNGCTSTSDVVITQPVPITETFTVTNVACYGESTGSATVTPVAGTSPYTYLWTPSAQTTATATALSAGTYSVKITDINGCTGSSSVTVIQPTLLTATANVATGILCNGGMGSAAATATGGSSPYTYTWTPRGGNSAIATGLIAGSYTVSVTDHNGCISSATVTMTQPAALKDTISSILHASCNLPNGKATVTVTGGVSPYTYLWTPTAQTNATATGLSVGNYSVTVTDNNHCTTSAVVTITQPVTTTAVITSVTNVGCFNGNNGAITVTASGGVIPYTYLWTPGGNTNATATGLFAVSYTVKVADANGCIATASATLTQPPVLTATISEPRIICKDSTGILVANAGGGTAPYRYTWSTGATSTNNSVSITPTSTIYYTVTVTDANGCTASGAITLQYGPSFSALVTGKNSVCVGDSTTICANAIGAMYGANYVWEPGNNTNACITTIPSSASIYTVTITDGCGAMASTTATVYTNPTPAVEMYADIYQGCIPFCVQFRDNSTISQGSINQYIWGFGNGDTMISQSPVYCYSSPGEYNVSLTVVSDSGCSATLKKMNMITAFSKPVANFIYSPQPVNILEPTVQFTDESADAYGIAYRWWNYGDGTGQAGTIDNPTHTYQDTGTFCPQLIVENNKGCTDTVTNCLFIEPLYTLYIPSAFSPNGDGLNDVFEAKGTYIKTFEMYVFDRWGMELFHSTDIHKGWDGTVHGGTAISQEDSYVYKIVVTDWDNIQHSYIGEVTLLK